MDAKTRKLELTEADFLGYDPDALRCNQCAGAFCGQRSGRVFNGEPIIMCGNKEETRKVLVALARR